MAAAATAWPNARRVSLGHVASRRPWVGCVRYATSTPRAKRAALGRRREPSRRSARRPPPSAASAPPSAAKRPPPRGEAERRPRAEGATPRRAREREARPRRRQRRALIKWAGYGRREVPPDRRAPPGEPPLRSAAGVSSRPLTRATRRSTTRPRAIPRRSGRGLPPSSSGARRGRRCSTGSRRTPSGSSAASSTRASTAWIGTSAAGAATRPRSSGKASPAIGARSPTGSSIATSASSPTSSSRSASARAIASRSTCRSSPNWPSRCSPARASAPSTAWSSAASAPSRCATASTISRRALLITADGGYRRGNVVQLKRVADEALQATPSIENVIVVQRRTSSPFTVEFTDGRDLWYHDLMRKAPLECEPEPMDAEDMLYILYTSGTTGKPKGIVHTTGGYLTGVLRDDEVGVRPEGRGRLLVHRRHRLGDRAQLRRVRAAGQRRDGRDVRGRTGLPAQGSVLGDRRALRRHDLLHGADGDSRVHEVGARVARTPRPLVAAPAGIGRRADQPRSVDVVPPLHRSRALPDRRHVVADRNRPHPDHAAAGDHPDQARLGDASVSRYLRRDPERGRIGRRASAAACSR